MNIKLSRSFLLPLFLLVMGCCATPISQMTDDEFIWTFAVIPHNYQSVYRSIKEGLLQQGNTGQNLDSDLYTDIQEGHFDVYATDIFGLRMSPFAKIRVKGTNDNQCELKVGQNPTWQGMGSNRGRFSNLVVQWAKDAK